MTDPKATGQDPRAVSTPAAPWAPPAVRNPPATHEPVSANDPPISQDAASAAGAATLAPRRRRRWPVYTLAALVAVLGLTAGLVVWAPWVPPPVLRPTGLVAGASTANSIAFRWSRPRTGPQPDRYLVLSNGTVVGSVARAATSYRQAGLTAATPYQYRVVAERGGKRSPQSALLVVRTLTPPISQGRLQGSWNIYAKNVAPKHVGRNGSLGLGFIPACTAGACDEMLYVKNGRHRFTMKLTRAGAVYRGHAVVNYSPCGSAGNSIPDPTRLTIRIRVTAATGQGQVWAATALAGTLAGTSRYVSSATFYCPSSTFKAVLSGTPG